MGGMEEVTVYLPRELKEALRESARASGRSEAELIREGIRVVTNSRGAVLPRIPLFASGIPDLAERVGEYLVRSSRASAEH